MAKITHDKETNILNIKIKSGKIVDSDTQGNCVVDYDSKGDILGLEVLDFNLEKASRKK